MRRNTRLWTWVLAGFACLILSVAALLSFLLRHGPSDHVWAVASVLRSLMPVAALVVSGLALCVTWLQIPIRRTNIENAPAQLNSAATRLAAASYAQVRIEAGRRQLFDPFPMSIPWEFRQEYAPHFPSTELNARETFENFGHEEQLLSSIDDVLRIYRNCGSSGRLVVLGDWGSGKSSISILLATGLFASRAAADPIPVLLSASTWDPDKEHLYAWIKRQLIKRNPWLSHEFGMTVVEDLVAQQRFLLIIDGLDDLPLKKRRQALDHLNRVLVPNLPVILTCRTEEYESCVHKGSMLRGSSTIELLPLRTDAIINYLTHAIPLSQHGVWTRNLSNAEDEPQSEIALTLTKPMTLWLYRTRLARHLDEANALTDLDHYGDRDSFERYLLGYLIPAVYPKTVSPDWTQKQRFTSAAATKRLRRFVGQPRSSRIRDFFAKQTRIILRRSRFFDDACERGILRPIGTTYESRYPILPSAPIKSTQPAARAKPEGSISISN